ncbi:MAG: indole-3-glycerol phosphate synthase TrpC [Xanthomonadales bacterium]|nr:indole-3-glycerol phosphate synthase TrpC [Xanthomonadales bacterium]
MPTVLERIIARKHEEIAQRSAALPLAELKARCAQVEPVRGFLKQLNKRVEQGKPAVIAEVKKASPSAGVIREDFQPAWIAQRYHAHGASCLSVLTDHDFFQGHEDYLQQARAACPLPVIRKDFTVDPWQVWESRSLGADAILLIMAALNDEQYQQLYHLARELQLDVLVEVHNEEELQRALIIKPPLLGINNRDLHRFKTDLATSERLVPQIPANTLVVGESGIHSADDIRRLRRSGIHTFLIGEAMMRAEDPGVALSELMNA